MMEAFAIALVAKEDLTGRVEIVDDRDRETYMTYVELPIAVERDKVGPTEHVEEEPCAQGWIVLLGLEAHLSDNLTHIRMIRMTTPSEIVLETLLELLLVADVPCLGCHNF